MVVNLLDCDGIDVDTPQAGYLPGDESCQLCGRLLAAHVGDQRILIDPSKLPDLIGGKVEVRQLTNRLRQLVRYSSGQDSGPFSFSYKRSLRHQWFLLRKLTKTHQKCFREYIPEGPDSGMNVYLNCSLDIRRKYTLLSAMVIDFLKPLASATFPRDYFPAFLSNASSVALAQSGDWPRRSLASRIMRRLRAVVSGSHDSRTQANACANDFLLSA